MNGSASGSQLGDNMSGTVSSLAASAGAGVSCEVRRPPSRQSLRSNLRISLRFASLSGGRVAPWGSKVSELIPCGRSTRDRRKWALGQDFRVVSNPVARSAVAAHLGADEGGTRMSSLDLRKVGRTDEICASNDCWLASAACTPASLPWTTTLSFSISRCATVEAFFANSSCLVASSSAAC